MENFNPKIEDKR